MTDGGELPKIIPGGAFAPPPRQFRCREGHVVEGPYWYYFGRERVQFCPTCFLGLIERECGGLEEVRPEEEEARRAEVERLAREGCGG